MIEAEAIEEKRFPVFFGAEKAVPRFSTWFSPAQIGLDAARHLFDYCEDGRLLWRRREGKRRDDAGSEIFRKRSDDRPVWFVTLGPRENRTRYMRRYLVWNWHHGITDRVLFPANGDPLDDRIENIALGDALDVPRCDHVEPATAPAIDAGAVCPCCRSRVPVLPLAALISGLLLPPQQATILSMVWAANGRPIIAERIIDALYADDPDGGPSPAKAYAFFKTQLSLLRGRLKGFGVSIETAPGNRGYWLKLGEP
ncbi:MAG: hypothetical protein HC900_00175 [Methylacidiphilales bacterium]|nr:hypothetical protein [Candidatus Methylacidiphilales bacterium]